MKKFLTAIILIGVMSGISFGAVSEDMNVYVRKDVFEVYMHRIDEKLDRIDKNFDKVFEELKVMRQDINDLQKSVVTLSERVNGLEKQMDGNYQTLSGRMDGNFQTLSGRIDGNYQTLSGRMDGNFQTLSERMDGNFQTLSGRIDSGSRSLSGRVDDLRQDIYLGIVLLGLIAAYPAAKEFFKWREEHREAKKSYLTAEDIERIIDAKLADIART